MKKVNVEFTVQEMGAGNDRDLWFLVVEALMAMVADSSQGLVRNLKIEDVQIEEVEDGSGEQR